MDNQSSASSHFNSQIEKSSGTANFAQSPRTGDQNFSMMGSSHNRSLANTAAHNDSAFQQYVEVPMSQPAIFNHSMTSDSDKFALKILKQGANNERSMTGYGPNMLLSPQVQRRGTNNQMMVLVSKIDNHLK